MQGRRQEKLAKGKITIKPVAIVPQIIEYVNKRLKEMGWVDVSMLREAMASCAIESNELADELLGTLDRILKKEKIGDRYLLQLAWFLRDVEDKEKVDGRKTKKGKDLPTV